RRDVRFGLADIGDGDVQLRLRRSAGRRQNLHALGVLLFLVQHRVCLSESSFGGFYLDLEWSRIELIQDIASLDVAALLEISIDDDAGYAGSHLGDPRWRNATWPPPSRRWRGGLQFDDTALLGDRRILVARSSRSFTAAGYEPSHQKGRCADAY